MMKSRALVGGSSLKPKTAISHANVQTKAINLDQRIDDLMIEANRLHILASAISSKLCGLASASEKDKYNATIEGKLEELGNMLYEVKSNLTAVHDKLGCSDPSQGEEDIG